MAKQVINLPGGFKGPVSAAVKAGDFIFVSGQNCPKDPETGEKIEGIEAQTRGTLERLKQVLEAAGASLDDVVKATIFLTNNDDFAKMNEVYGSYFAKDPPARKTIIMLPHQPGVVMEIECIAYRPQG